MVNNTTALLQGWCTKKLKPLITRQNAKPRCFKNVGILSCQYSTNLNAWMTSSDWRKTLLGINLGCLVTTVDSLFDFDTNSF